MIKAHWLVCCGVVFLSLFRQAQAESLTIMGWPFVKEPPSQILARLKDDPVLGRLACPPLTRLNLRTQEGDELLLREVKVEPRRWRMQLRSGLTWWNGEPVVARDLVEFVSKNIKDIVFTRSGGLWTVPDFAISTRDHNSVTIEWQNQPIFGPYVFNGVPFAREHKGGIAELSFECVGLYRLKHNNGTYELEQRSGLNTRLSLLKVLSEDSPAAAGGDISFKLSSNFGGNPWTRPGDMQASCEATVDLPVATMIVWNTTDGPTKDPDFRRVLTQLVPRGPILRAGGAGLGELLSAPIPRNHPGYNQGLALRPSDLDAASKRLDQLGYKRSGAGMLRKVKGSQRELNLVIVGQNHTYELIEKVVVDAFQAIGIGVRFVSNGNSLKSAEQWDGVIGTFDLDWPDSNLLLNFHSKLIRNEADTIFKSVGDTGLDAMLERYAVSLTQRDPNFALLSSIHARLYELEPVTVVMQHKICLETGGALKVSKHSIDSRDPDWFRQLLTPHNAE